MKLAQSFCFACFSFINSSVNTGKLHTVVPDPSIFLEVESNVNMIVFNIFSVNSDIGSDVLRQS